jgi:hypothetical protein
MDKKDLERAESIRMETINALKKYNPNYSVHCPSCNRDQVKRLEQDGQYHLLAYQQMTPEQILMSHERVLEVQHKEIWDYIVKVRKAEEQARKSKLIVSAQE